MDVAHLCVIAHSFVVAAAGDVVAIATAMLLLLLPWLLLLVVLQQNVIGELIDCAGTHQSGFTRLVSSR